MKEIRLFIENTSAPYIKHILILYFFILIFQPLLVLMNINVMNTNVEFPNPLMMIILYLGFLVLFILHHKRYKTFMNKGGLTRIRLLPIAKTSFLYSELLFQFISYLGLFCANIIAWTLLYFLLRNQQPFQEHSYLFFMLSNTTSATYLPMTWNTLLFDLLTLINLTCISVFLLLGKDSDKYERNSLLYISMLALIFLFNWICKIENQLTELFEIMPLLSALVLLTLHPLILKSSFLWKRRKPK